MFSVPDEYASLLASIENGMAVLVAGAGVSRGSGLPTVDDLVRLALEPILASCTVTEETKAIVAADAPHRLRFEVLMEILTEILGELRGLAPLCLLEGGVPGPVHRLGAALVAQGNNIITTNFDELFEVALKADGTPAMVISSDEDVRIRSRAHSSVIKIHGSVTRASSAAATIRRVGCGLTQLMVESARGILAGRTIVVMGYSGRDYCTLMPLLLEQSVGPIAWFDHSFGGEQSRQGRTIQQLLKGRRESRYVLEDTASVATRLGVAIGVTNQAHPSEQLRARTDRRVVSYDLLLANEANLIVAGVLENLGYSKRAYEVYGQPVERDTRTLTLFNLHCGRLEARGVDGIAFECTALKHMNQAAALAEKFGYTRLERLANVERWRLLAQQCTIWELTSTDVAGERNAAILMTNLYISIAMSEGDGELADRALECQLWLIIDKSQEVGNWVVKEYENLCGIMECNGGHMHLSRCYHELGLLKFSEGDVAGALLSELARLRSLLLIEADSTAASVQACLGCIANLMRKLNNRSTEWIGAVSELNKFGVAEEVQRMVMTTGESQDTE